MKRMIWCCLLALSSACAHTPGQNQYNYNEVGQSVIVEFASVVAVRPVAITGHNSGTGALTGAGAGAAAGLTVGTGNGTLLTTAGGAIAGAVAGSAGEQLASNRSGYEYVVVTENKKTKTLVQYAGENDRVFAIGDRVMLQTKGTYQRLLPTDNLPAQIKRPHGIDIVE